MTQILTGEVCEPDLPRPAGIAASISDGHTPSQNGPSSADAEWDGPQPTGPPKYFDEIPPADPSTDRYAKPVRQNKQRHIDQSELDFDDPPPTVSAENKAHGAALDFQKPITAESKAETKKTHHPDTAEDF